MKTLVMLIMLLAAGVGFGLLVLAEAWSLLEGTGERPSPLTPPYEPDAPATTSADEPTE